MDMQDEYDVYEVSRPTLLAYLIGEGEGDLVGRVIRDDCEGIPVFTSLEKARDAFGHIKATSVRLRIFRVTVSYFGEVIEV